MACSKYLFLNICLFILLLSFSISSAHDKPHNSTKSKSPKSCPPPPSNEYKNCFSKVFAFGDSYTDTGNAYFMGGLGSFLACFSHSHYGSTFFRRPSNRLCNGRLVIDFITEALGLQNLPPYKDTAVNFTHGCNFAIAGSTSFSGNFFLHNKIHHSLMWKEVPESFRTQIEWFRKFLSNVECQGEDDVSCKSKLKDVLFWIGPMGISDYTLTFEFSISQKWQINIQVDHVCQLVKANLEKGAKYIVVQGLPPAGCLPFDLSLSKPGDRDEMGCSASVNSMIVKHNELLQKKLKEIQKTYPSCMIVYADLWNAFKTILTNPSKFGIEETSKTCCGCGFGELNFDSKKLCSSNGATVCSNPSKYIHWDGVHLTEAMNQHIADLLFRQGFCHPSFDQQASHRKSL
ncbi:GDSL lipase/esterase [Dillenia turbinata]|uniref:GDSL lipase/esterase n=1 Tax=Dillenia turbinata TaxID=194707 RepID=A0AAN8UX16_9MAGN